MIRAMKNKNTTRYSTLLRPLVTGVHHPLDRYGLSQCRRSAAVQPTDPWASVSSG
jgi:hypothetical protein